MSQVLSQLIQTARTLSETGLVTGAGGNVSARDNTGKHAADPVMWISPSGFSFEDATENDYPAVSIKSGEIVKGDRRPSSEVLMHLWVYRVRPEVNAIIHTHPKITIALTSSGHDLKPMFADYYVYLGANVPHVDYVTVTTPELAKVVEQGFGPEDVYGMVLRNHGAITVGTSIKEAYFRTLAIEEQAVIQWHALAVGTPTFLSDEECAKLDQLGSEEYRRNLLAQMKAD